MKESTSCKSTKFKLLPVWVAGEAGGGGGAAITGFGADQGEHGAEAGCGHPAVAVAGGRGRQQAAGRPGGGRSLAAPGLVLWPYNPI